ncbi:glycosyltransferase family 1 protein [Stenotrophomonas sp. ZAC14D1_NAIMI4_6]|uniref:glycosyltransferase family 4 protein n=1 Tax=Stenotrophomonas maltophilia group TaxID=995085 RepID=UPI0009A1428E|nr:MULTISPECIES: glycosyltransferase family 4 protein [Stenotrophomonas maltophilia group]AWH38259.1 glycosyltransferase family 1 protein [Stenotrophomonas sp. ZAC14D1_NAIMI4_6]AWH42390.1 glycosyltransferase family 1 protein [Stenotrophomonas sp. ZAC14D1_NAIMI4_1]
MNAAQGQLQHLLVVTRNLPPLQGGMERLNWHLLQQVQHLAAVQVIAPEGSAERAPAGIPVREVPLRPLWRFLVNAMWCTLTHSMRNRRGTCLAGSGLTAPHAWLASRLSGGRCVAYLHGLDISVDNAAYRTLWLPVLRRLDLVIVNSRATAALATEAGIDPERIHIVHPGTALPTIPHAAQRTAEAVDFRERHGLGKGPLILSVGRLTRRKGMMEFVRDVLPLVLAAHPDAFLVVVGATASQALASEAVTPAQLIESASSAVRERIRFVGELSDEELGISMCASAVHVFPVRSQRSDPEGFGMVAIEAAAHGLTTVAYASGGVADAVANGISGFLIEPGDSSGYATAVIHAIDAPLPAEPMRAFAMRFSWDAFGAKVRELLSSVTRR